MSVVRTDKWLARAYQRPLALCEKLIQYFEGKPTREHIQQHLVMHGLYQKPQDSGEHFLKALQKHDIWHTTQRIYKNLQDIWDGPAIPIFIFPADPYNRKLQRELGGKSGLSFPDKIFLFVSEHTTPNEIQALLTHEYHHVCRLAKYDKHETDYVLLDTIVLEGLAEHAVREEIGSRYTADWTSYYSNAKLKYLYHNLILPNRHVPKFHPRHDEILYGLGLLPHMAGYCTGYYLVQHYMTTHDLTTQAMLDAKPEIFINKTDDSR